MKRNHISINLKFTKTKIRNKFKILVEAYDQDRDIYHKQFLEKSLQAESIAQFLKDVFLMGASEEYLEEYIEKLK